MLEGKEPVKRSKAKNVSSWKKKGSSFTVQATLLDEEKTEDHRTQSESRMS